MIRVAKNKSALAALSLLLLAGATASVFNADLAIERGFATVIAQGANLSAPAANPTANMTPTDTAANIVSGSEDYWLRAPADANGTGPTNVERVVWHGPVAAGGTLVIGSGSSRKELEVISIEPAAEQPATRIDMSMGTPAPLRVQARDGQNILAPALWLELTHLIANDMAPPIPLLAGHSL